MRLDRFLANMGCGSRNEVKKLIRAGQAMVNDIVIKQEDTQINPGTDRIIFKGKKVEYHEYIYLMLNKPAGVISATKDTRERTVLDLLNPKYFNKGIFPVGRLDKDTEGLLLLTNHGELGHRLLAPKKRVAKRYYVKVGGEIGAKEKQSFQNGITLEDGLKTLPADLEIIKGSDPAEVIVTIYEGKFHQIKRMFQSLGKRVIYLKRTAMGSLRLDPALHPGEYRELTKEETETLISSCFNTTSS